jgi:TonB family protein
MRWLRPGRLVAALLAVASVCAVARRGEAQAPGGASPALVPPRPVSELTVAYPRGARGDGVVVLTLVIDSDGRVREARLTSGDAPFAAAAAAAAMEFRFSPATRDGAPVAATIRVQLRFTEPPAGGPARPDGTISNGNTPSSQPPPDAPRGGGEAGSAPAPTARPGAPGASPQRDDSRGVTVLGQRAPPGATSLTRAEVRQLPGAFGDPFRAIESLPGVTPIVSGAPFFYVRGAPPGNVGYFLDGVRVPYLFHVFLGPSVIHPALVSRVDLFPGGYPAQFGRFAGAVVSAELAPPVPVLHGEAVVRLFDAGALVEAPFAGGKGTALVGGRYSYTAALFSLASPSTQLDYWDYQARLTYDVAPGERLTAMGFGARDFLGERDRTGTGKEDKTFFDTQFHRLDLRYDIARAGGDRVRLAVTLGLDRTGTEGSQRYRDRMVGLRANLVHPLSDRVVLRGGADVVLDVYDNDLNLRGDPPVDEQDLSQRLLFPSRRELAMGAYVDAVVQVSRAVTVTPGLRADLYGTYSDSSGAVAGFDPAAGPQSEVSLDPRLMGRFEVSEGVRILHAYGVAHQPPSFVVPLPGFSVNRRRRGLQQSLQASAGVEADLPLGFTGSATGFRDVFLNMSDALSTSHTTTGGPAAYDQRSLGSSVGLEVLVRRSLSRRVGGYLSYTLSRSQRSLGRSTFPAGFDRTHVASGAIGAELGGGFRGGTRLVFYTGTPRYTDENPLQHRPAQPERIPPFFRVDLRLERRFRVGEAGTLAVVAELLNATFSREVLGTTCTNKGCEDQYIGPVVVPSLGVEAAF